MLPISIAGEDISPCTNLPVPSLGALGLCCCRQWDWRAMSLGKESPHCPVEMAELPKVGQVNLLRRADLLVTMDIAQLYTNNPPGEIHCRCFPPLFVLQIFPERGVRMHRGAGVGNQSQERENGG